MPVRNIGKHGYKSDLKALCCMYFLVRRQLSGRARCQLRVAQQQRACVHTAAVCTRRRGVRCSWGLACGDGGWQGGSRGSASTPSPQPLRSLQLPAHSPALACSQPCLATRLPQMSCIFSCGIGQVATCCGSGLICNFGAWFSCHARERLRR